MKLTTEQLRKIIKEELKNLLDESAYFFDPESEHSGTPGMHRKLATKGIEQGTWEPSRQSRWGGGEEAKYIDQGPTAFDRSYDRGMEQKEFAKRASGGTPDFQKVAAQGGVVAYVDKFRDGWKVVYKSPNSDMWFSTIGHPSSDDAFADIVKNHEIQLGSVDIADPAME